MKNKMPIVRGLMAAAGCVAIPQVAWSQTASEQPAVAQSVPDVGQEPNPSGAQDIIVTARKQGETVLRTPATVTVLEPAQLAAANITNINQLSGIVPGLIMMQGTAGTSAGFRGLGTTSPDPSMESSVATFMDGIYMGHPRDFTLPLYDVAQVELIKGTQSTLLGKNSSLGALSITSRRPGSVFAVDGSAAYNAGIDGYQLKGGVDVPLGGDFAIRVAGLFNDERGYVRNAYIGRDERQVTEWSGRAVLEGKLGSSGDLTVIYQHDDRRGDGHYFELLTDPNNIVVGRATALGQANFDKVGNDRSYSGSDAVGPGNVASPLQFDDQSGDRATAIVSFDLGGVDLTSQTGWFGWNSNRFTDLDLTRASLLGLSDRERNRTLSQELRIASQPGNALSWLVGVFLYDNDWRLARTVNAQTGGGVFPLAGGYNTQIRIDTQAVSGFASARYALSDMLTLSAGVRYTSETKTPTYERTSNGFFALPSQSAPIPRTKLDGATENSLDGDIGIQYVPNGRQMFYATLSKGSKSGGFQNNPTTLGAARYEGERAYTAEIGSKLGFANGFLTGAVFKTWVDDFQSGRVDVVDGFAQSVISNGSVGATGFEAAGSWRPAPGFSLDASVVYSDATFRREFGGSGGLVAAKGTRLLRAPLWTGHVGAKYERPLTSGLDLRLGTSMDYASKSNIQFNATDPLAPIGRERATLDAQIAVGSPSKSWELAVVGTNITDTRFVVFDTAVSGAPDAYYGSRNRPRVISLQLRMQY